MIEKQKRTKPLTKDGLRNAFGDLYIMEFYLGAISLKRNYVNPIRPTDRTPSGRFYINNDILAYKDFADSDYSFDVFKYVMTTFKLNFVESLERIATDLNYDESAIYIPRIKKISLLGESDNSVSAMTKKFSVNSRPFNSFDLAYWNQFNITEQTLNLFNVNPVFSYVTEHLDTGNEQITYVDKHYDPCYNYKFTHKLINYDKFYRPLVSDRKYKWRNNCNSTVVQGLEQLKYKSKVLFITSSLKDVMTLYSLGYEAVAPQSENVRIDKSLMDDFLFAYSKIVVFYDYDKAGKKGSDKLKESFPSKRIKVIYTQDDTYKDISDYMKAHGVDKTEELIQRELKLIKVKIKK